MEDVRFDITYQDNDATLVLFSEDPTMQGIKVERSLGSRFLNLPIGVRMNYVSKKIPEMYRELCSLVGGDSTVESTQRGKKD